MKNRVFNISLIAAFVLAAVIVANAQDGSKPDSTSKSDAHSSSAGMAAAKVPVIIVGSAAKATWVTTKFTAKHLAKPVAKAVFVEATPTMTRFAVKNGVKYLLPYALKLSLL